MKEIGSCLCALAFNDDLYSTGDEKRDLIG